MSLTMISNRTASFALLVCLAGHSSFGADEKTGSPSKESPEHIFPADAVVNVTLPPYEVHPDDGKDDTAAIQRAITENNLPPRNGNPGDKSLAVPLFRNPIPAESGGSIFEYHFDDARTLDSWRSEGTGSASIDSGALKVHTDKLGNHLVSISIPVEKLRGRKVTLSGKVKLKDVHKAAESWHGAKLMLQVNSPAGPQYYNVPELAGTFDWRDAGISAGIPEDASEVRVILGQGEASGTAWFDDVAVKITGEQLAHPAVHVELTPPEKLDRRTAVPRFRGVMYGPHGHEADLRKLGEWKANLIRWQFYNYEAQSPQKSLDLSAYDRWLAETMEEVDRALPLCRELGIAIIIDLHTPPGAGNTSQMPVFNNAILQKKFIEVWDRLATHYASESAIWGYDLLNEPVEGYVAPGLLSWHALAEVVAQRVRKIDPNHAIIVEPGPAGGWGDLPYFKPIEVPGIIYSVHMYEPLRFTHQGVLNGFPAGVNYPGTIAGVRWDKEALRRSLEPVRQYQKDFNVPIYIGEFSAARWAPNDSAAAWLRDCIAIFEEFGWDWSYHAFREWHGWNVELGPDPKITEPSVAPTSPQRVLVEAFSKNHN